MIDKAIDKCASVACHPVACLAMLARVGEIQAQAAARSYACEGL